MCFEQSNGVPVITINTKSVALAPDLALGFASSEAAWDTVVGADRQHLTIVGWQHDGNVKEP